MVPHKVSGVTEIVLDGIGARTEMGQYAFLNIPAISTLEWHPFSISSAPSDDYTTFHVKNMGKGTFTGKLFELAQTMGQSDVLTLQQSQELAVSVDGGYGRPFDPSQYDEVILCGGGIGITPLHSIFRELRAQSASGGRCGDAQRGAGRRAHAQRACQRPPAVGPARGR